MRELPESCKAGIPQAQQAERPEGSEMTHKQTEHEEVMVEAKSFELCQATEIPLDVQPVFRVEHSVVTLQPSRP